MLRCKELSVSLKTNQTSLSEFVPLHGDLSRDTLGDAIQSLREAIRLNPKKNYHKLLAQALTKNPKWVKDAKKQLRLALEFNEFDAECYLSLGDIYDTAGMTTRAQKMYEQALTYDPENSELRQKLGENHRGSTLGGIKKIFGREKD